MLNSDRVLFSFQGVATNLFGRWATTTNAHKKSSTCQYNMNTPDSNIHNSSNSSCHSPTNPEDLLTSTPRSRYDGISNTSVTYGISRDLDDCVINNGQVHLQLRESHGHILPYNQMAYELADPDTLASHSWKPYSR